MFSERDVLSEQCVCVIRVSWRSALWSTGVWSQLDRTERRNWNGGGAYKSSTAPCGSNSRPVGVATFHLRPPLPGRQLSNSHWTCIFNVFSLFYVSGLATLYVRNGRKQVIFQVFHGLESHKKPHYNYIINICYNYISIHVYICIHTWTECIH